MEREERFRAAIDENYQRIKSLCRYYFGNSGDADDACQETLIKIWQNILTFRGESQLKTWITRITVNVCLTHISQNRRKTTVFRPIGENDDNGNEDFTEEASQEEEKLRFFREFTSRLNPADKVLVSLYLEETDYREIADVTGLTEVNARTRIHRIKGQIKKEWEDKYGTR